MASMAAASRKFPAIFTTFALDGSAPTASTPWPIGANTGPHRSSTSGAPAATIQSFAAFAISGRPHTGAAT